MSIMSRVVTTGLFSAWAALCSAVIAASFYGDGQWPVRASAALGIGGFMTGSVQAWLAWHEHRARAEADRRKRADRERSMKQRLAEDNRARAAWEGKRQQLEARVNALESSFEQELEAKLERRMRAIETQTDDLHEKAQLAAEAERLLRLELDDTARMLIRERHRARAIPVRLDGYRSLPPADAEPSPPHAAWHTSSSGRFSNILAPVAAFTAMGIALAGFGWLTWYLAGLLLSAFY